MDDNDETMLMNPDEIGDFIENIEFDITESETLLQVIDELIEFGKELHLEVSDNEDNINVIFKYILAFFHDGHIPNEFDFIPTKQQLEPMKERLLKVFPKYKKWTHLLFHGKSMTFTETYYYHRAMELIVQKDVRSLGARFSLINIHNDMKKHKKSIIQTHVSEETIFYLYNMWYKHEDWISCDKRSMLKDVVKIRYLLRECWNLTETSPLKLLSSRNYDLWCVLAHHSGKEAQERIKNDKNLLRTMIKFKRILNVTRWFFLEKMSDSFQYFINTFMEPFDTKMLVDKNSICSLFTTSQIHHYSVDSKKCVRCSNLEKERKYWKSLHYLVYCYMENKQEYMKQAHDVFSKLIDEYKHQGEALEKLFSCLRKK